MERGGAVGKGKGYEASERCNTSHPGELLLDEYLKNQGLYRKRIAKDGSCLFRAVSEQFIEGSFDEYLKHLEKPQEWVGQVEISALSLMYKRDFIIYQEPNRPPAHVTENGFPDTILLCFSNGNHYDSVYPGTFVDAAAFCQSILYEMLYQNVFKVDVAAIMPAMLDANSEVNEEHLNASEDSNSDTEIVMFGGKTANEGDMNGFKLQSCNKAQKKQQMKSESSAHITFPRKVLQALNPNVYRNIEYEVWLKSEQAQQKRDYSIAAGMQYTVGDKCKVCLDNGKCYNAHIQAVNPDNGPVVVYIEQLGEKHSVPLQNLRPLTQVSRGATWNRVQGKRTKKLMSVNSEADFKGVKNSSNFVNKPSRLQSSLPPRLQQTMGTRQQSSTQQTPGQQPKKSSTEYVGRDEDFPQLSKKYDRGLEPDYTNVECKHFAPSVKAELETDEVQAPPKMHLRVEQSIPVLHNPLEMPAYTATQRMDPVLQSDLRMSHLPSSATSLTPPVLSVHPPESVTCQSAESLPQTVIPPVSLSPSVMSSPAVSQAQVTSAFITPLCAPMHGANLPPMPALQIPNSYDDLLYPGFAVNEKGEYLTSAPVYSYNKNGADLPNDKSILRFFYNLGVKAYSLPLWAPYSYLYPLNQAYLKSCGIYPRGPAPVFHPNPWFHVTAGLMHNENVTIPPHMSNPPETNAPGQSVQRDVNDDGGHAPLPQATTPLLPHKNESVLEAPTPEQLPQNFNPLFARYFPNFISDGTQHSGWRAPIPQALFSQNTQMHAFSFHPMYMALPNHVFPLQVNSGSSACQNDQKVGAPDVCEQVSGNSQSDEIGEMGRQPEVFTSAGEGRLSKAQPGSFKNSQLSVKPGGGIGNKCPFGEEQSTANPHEGCAKQHSSLRKEKESLLIDKLNPASGTGLAGVDAAYIEPQKLAGVDASHSEFASQPFEAKSRSDLILQCVGESKVDTMAHAVEVTFMDQTSENNYKMSAILSNSKPVQFYGQTLGKERHYIKEDSSSERTVYRRSPYVRKKGEREISRKKWQGKPLSSKSPCCLSDSHVDSRGTAADTKRASKSPTKDSSVQGVNSVAQVSETPVGLGADRHESKNENIQEKVKNQRFCMSQNRLDEEPGPGNRRDHDAKEFQNRVVVENASGVLCEGKRNSFKKQRYREGGKPNPGARKW
ncbi:OTU domain-containing protein 4 isoform X2 [Carcharodon carcharias]|uniref:OTU domain-containing protein 4 isoform X2 n=1 Tax=Carcharodon carcharias TaxID=13397 RepID=UPI001B7DDBA2|nr:OTU domain-containing protein 4 isoform X2 [Carcharodon carcharias]